MIEELLFCLPIPKDQEGESFLFKRLLKEDNLLPKNISIDNRNIKIDLSVDNPTLQFKNKIRSEIQDLVQVWCYPT